MNSAFVHSQNDCQVSYWIATCMLSRARGFFYRLKMIARSHTGLRLYYSWLAPFELSLLKMIARSHTGLRQITAMSLQGARKILKMIARSHTGLRLFSMSRLLLSASRTQNDCQVSYWIATYNYIFVNFVYCLKMIARSHTGLRHKKHIF